MNMGVEVVISEKVSVLGGFSNGILLKCSNSKTTINKSFVMEVYSLVNSSYIRQNSDVEVSVVIVRHMRPLWVPHTLFKL